MTRSPIKLACIGALVGLPLALVATGASAQHVDVGPGGVRLNADHGEVHHERRVIEERRGPDHHDNTGTVVIERRQGHYEDHHDD